MREPPKNDDCHICKVEVNYVIHIRYDSDGTLEDLTLYQCPICKRLSGKSTEE